MNKLGTRRRTEPAASELGRNPFPGARPFEVDERSFFHGRTTELAELVSLVLAQQLVLLYAPSGAGKSSLIYAGLWHELEEDRNGENDDDTPPAAGTFDILGVANVHPGAVRGAEGWPSVQKVPNVYMTAALNSLGAGGRSSHTTLISYLNAQPQRSDEFGDPLPRLIILDQFEEILEPYGRSDWLKSRDDFIAHLDAALVEDPSLHVLISIREDHLATIERLMAGMQTRLQARYRLDKLRVPRAREAIEMATEKSGLPIAKDALEQLIGELSQRQVSGLSEPIPDEFVDPGLLSVVGRRLWARADADARKRPHVRPSEITMTDVSQLGGVQGALERYYEDAIVSVSNGVSSKIRHFFERDLITEHNTRQLVPYDPESTKTRGIDSSQLESLRNDYGLLRREQRGGTNYWELAHDGFIQPIRTSNRRHREAVRRWQLTALQVVIALGIVAALIINLWPEGRPPPLSDNEPLLFKGSLEPETSFYFQGTEGEIVEIGLRSISDDEPPFPAKLNLVDSSRRSLAEVTQVNPSLPAVRLPQDGDYEIVPSTVEDLGDRTPFEIEARLLREEEREAKVGEEIVDTLIKGTAHLWELDPSGTAPGDRLTVATVVTPEGGATQDGILFQLLDPSDHLIGQSSGQVDSEGSELFSAILASGETYRILVTGSGTYKFKIDKGEAPTSGDIAASIEEGARNEATFFGTSGQLTSVVLTPTPTTGVDLLHATLEVVDPNGNLLGIGETADGRPVSIGAVLPVDGAYQVIVTGFSPGDYQLVFREETTAGRIDFGGTQDGNIKQGTGVAFFSFESDPEMRVALITLRSPETSLRAQVDVINDAGVPLKQAVLAPGQSAEILVVTSPGRTNFVIVSGMSTTPGVVSVGLGQGDTDLLSAQDAARGEIRVPFEEVAYAFVVDTGAKGSVFMEPANDSELDSTLQLWGPEGQLIAQDDKDRSRAYDLAARMEYEIQAEGTYIVLASGYKESIGQFKLTLTKK